MQTSHGNSLTTLGQEISLKPSRTHPFLARVRERYPLTKPGSTKQTYHVSLDLKGSGIDFKVGDALGILPKNDPVLVRQFLEAMGAGGEELVFDPRSKEQLTLRSFLSDKANLVRLTSSFLKLFPQDPELSPLLQKENKELLIDFLGKHEPLDLLRKRNKPSLPLQELVSCFGPLLPRFYSVASSLKVLKEEVHLTVALFHFNHEGEPRHGVASYFLCHLAEENVTPIPIYVQPSAHFTLPADPHAPVIMIGPGTGVAPFRAFLQERVALGHPGKNWLFFGERNRATDYFYEDFWTGHATQGRLRLDVAFSRDQKEKLYVQHKMAESGKDLWAWIQEGAYVYVCGDAEKMAKEVDAAFHQIAEIEGGLSHEGAKEWIRALRAQKRYIFDVY